MGAIREVQNALANAAASGQKPRRVRISPKVYERLLAEYPGGHPELPVEHIRQLSTDFGLVDVIIDDSAEIQVESTDA